MVHAIGFVIFALIVSFLPELLPAGDGQTDEAPAFQPADERDDQTPDFTKFVLGSPQEKPSSISTEALGQMQPQGGTPIYIDDAPDFVGSGGMSANLPGADLGGLGGFTVQGIPGIGGPGGVGIGPGTGTLPGSGGGLVPGFGPRNRGNRPGGPGGTQATDHAVLGGLIWIAKHQGPNGAWSIQHSRFCPTKQGCDGAGGYQSDVAATALALLPFLGAGQTHQTRNGPFTKQIDKGLNWLIRQQAPDGGLWRRPSGRVGDDGEINPMYTHAVATIVLCEAYGLTHDPKVGAAASKAVRYIELAQNESTGGWRYHPRDPDSDTSVLGWQVMALKSAQMAGLGVNSVTLESPRKWLASVATGRNHGLFRYQPYRAEEPSMTAVGQLCLQYMGLAPDDAALLEGKEYLMANLPSSSLHRDIYYWYYATLVLHNYLDGDWDKWDRDMRKILVHTQVTEGCGTGSWDPSLPTPDRWGSAGGRLYVTSLSVLTLEVYYRYMPLFRLKGPPPALPSTDPNAPAADDASGWKPSSKGSKVPRKD